MLEILPIRSAGRYGFVMTASTPASSARSRSAAAVFAVTITSGVAEIVIRSHCPADLETVESRHHPVEHDQLRTARTDSGKAGETVGRGFDLVARSSQADRRERHEVRVVVDHQQACHGVPSVVQYCRA
jgi:hypothetical protein